MRPNTLGDRERLCTLVSASCTTSWFDWMHGELWLCDDGLFRRSLGLMATMRRSISMYSARYAPVERRRTIDPVNRPTRNFGPHDISDIVARGRRNRWIPWTEIQHATLKLGILDNSLHLDLTRDRHEKFLWLAIDRGYEFLAKELPPRLPGRLVVSDQRVG
jgi:hypothetical protein